MNAFCRSLILSLIALAACAEVEPTTVEATAEVAGAWAPPLTSTFWRIGFNIVNPSVPGFGNCFQKPLNQLVHSGEDWANAAGTAVHAIGAGTVVYAQFANYPGNVVVIRHDLSAAERAALGISNASVFSMYGHLGTLAVSVNQAVSVGQTVGTILDQGANSHVHWEVRTVMTPQLCSVTPPGPGYTNTGTDARSFGYLSPSGSVAALQSSAPPATCDNNVPIGGTACNPSDPVAQYVCTTPGAGPVAQWTRQLCPTNQSCAGDRCQGGAIPRCGANLFCALNPIPGSTQCFTGTQNAFCCAPGHTIVNGACSP
jgi:murein DD-endopeptidase MepM/ murein hydrolase activator NlpD